MSRLIVIWHDKNEASYELRKMIEESGIAHEAHRAKDEMDKETLQKLPVVLEEPGGYFEGESARVHVEEICAHHARKQQREQEAEH